MLNLEPNQLVIVLGDKPEHCRVYAWKHQLVGIRGLRLTTDLHQLYPDLSMDTAGLPSLAAPVDAIELLEEQITIEVVDRRVKVFLGGEQVGCISHLHLDLHVEAPEPRLSIDFAKGLSAEAYGQVSDPLRTRLGRHLALLHKYPWVKVTVPQ